VRPVETRGQLISAWRRSYRSKSPESEGDLANPSI